MRHSFEGTVALVTGGVSGIGRAVVQGFAAGGARLVIADIDPEAGNAFAESLRQNGTEAVFVRTDVTRGEDVEGMVAVAVKAFGRLDIAHNNVGGGSPNPSLTDLTEDEWDRTFALCLKSCWLGMKYQIPQMLRQGGGGAIVNTAALAGQVVTEMASPAYSAAKAGVIHLTRHTAVTHGKFGIRVNAISPGLTATPEVLRALTPEQRDQVAQQCHPMPRMATPEEQASAALWLCSDAAAFVNGVTVPVDGGWAAK